MYNKELAYFDTVVQLTQKSDPDDYLSYARQYRARIYFFIGDYQKSANEYTLAINAMRLQTRDDTLRYIRLFNYRTQSYMSENKLSKALSDIEKVLTLANTLKNHFEIATAYKTKALIFEKENNPQAELFFKQAIFERLLTKDSFYIANDYIDLGDFYQSCFMKFSEAEKMYKSAVLFSKNISESSKRSINLFAAYEGLGRTNLQEDKLNQAAQYYAISLASVNINVSNALLKNPSSTQLISLQNTDYIFDFLFGKTKLLLKLYGKEKSYIYLQACLQTALLTDSIITQIRFEQGEEESKLYWRDETRKFFNNAIEASYLLDSVDKAVYFLEQSRAALLNDTWNEMNANTQLSMHEVSYMEFLRIKLIEQQQKMSSLTTTTGKDYYALEANFLKTKDSLEHFIKSLEKKYPFYYQSKYADDVPSLQSLQQYLAQNNQSFVYYFMSDSATYALAITKNKTNFIKIPASDFDNHQLSQFIKLCSDKQEFNHKHDVFCSLSQTLYNKLFKPLDISKGNVAICTDNFFIPFEALCRDDKGKDFLLTDYNFSYVYSARSLLKTFATKAASGNFIGFAPVSFSSSLAVPDLTQSSTALQNTSQHYSNHTLFTRQEATRNNFFVNAPRYSVVVIFSHAKADTTDAEPELFMQDSVVHLSELQRLINPSIQFVLLSACQTNIGKNATGEGIYSLARGFAAAGIPSVSATLWKADEEAVYQISTQFNEYLATGMNKSEALQKAKLLYLKNADHEHTMPYYWANMVLIGSSQPIVLSSSNHLWLWVSGVMMGVVLLMFLFYFIFFKNKKERAIHTN